MWTEDRAIKRGYWEIDETGILKRQTRSIQTEGHFGDIKENEDFRRDNYCSAEKVYREFMLYAISRNIMK